MSNDYLTQTDIKEITGYQYPSKQIKQLIKLGISHIIRPDGYPRVLRAERDRVMMGQVHMRPRTEPDFDALDK